MTDLPGVFATVAPWIEDYGYAAVFVLVLIENFGIPMPGEATLVTAALFTTLGTLDLRVLVVVGFAAAVVGDNLGYAFGRFGGRPLVLRLGRRFGVTNDLLDKVEQFYARHGAKMVSVARFLPIMRHLNGIAAGTSKMGWNRFLVANMAGAAIWVAVWTFVGVQMGSHIEAVSAGLDRGALYAGIAIVLLIVGYVLWRRLRRPATDGLEG